MQSKELRKYLYEVDQNFQRSINSFRALKKYIDENPQSPMCPNRIVFNDRGKLTLGELHDICNEMGILRVWMKRFCDELKEREQYDQ